LTLAEPIEVTLAVVGALERLGLRYLVGGSMASSVHGVPRATQDIDLLVELRGRSVEELVSPTAKTVTMKLLVADYNGLSYLDFGLAWGTGG